MNQLHKRSLYSSHKKWFKFLDTVRWFSILKSLITLNILNKYKKGISTCIFYVERIDFSNGFCQRNLEIEKKCLFNSKGVQFLKNVNNEYAHSTVVYVFTTNK